MSFNHWLRKVFGPRMQVSRAPRHGKARKPSQLRYLPTAETLEERLAPATLIVNSRDDNTTSGDNLLTLREAILSIEQGRLLDSSASGQLTGVFGDKDTVQFAPSIDGGFLQLSITINDSTVVGPSAFLIDHAITLDGRTGLTLGLTIKPGGWDDPATVDCECETARLFYVNSAGDLTIESLTLMGGSAQGGAGGTSGFGGAGGGGAGLGGAIFNNQGTVRILDSTLTGNTAQGGVGGSFYRQDDALGGHGGAGGGGTNGAGRSAVSGNNGGDGGGPSGGSGGVPGRETPDPGEFGGGGGGGFSSDESPAGAPGGFGGGGGGGGSGGSEGGAGGNGAFGGGGGGGAGTFFTYPYGSTGGRKPVDNPGGGGGFGGGPGVKAYNYSNSNTPRAGGGGAGMGGAIF